MSRFTLHMHITHGNHCHPTRRNVKRLELRSGEKFLRWYKMRREGDVQSRDNYRQHGPRCVWDVTYINKIRGLRNGARDIDAGGIIIM